MNRELEDWQGQNEIEWLREKVGQLEDRIKSALLILDEECGVSGCHCQICEASKLLRGEEQ